MGIKNWVGGWFSKSKPLRQGDTALVVAPPTGPRFDEPPKGDFEKMSGGPAVILPYFLPFFDPQQTVGETQLQRLAYRVMLADPTVKASLFAKIFGVAALELNVNPPTDKPRDAKIADFVKWNLTQRIMEGLPGLVWSVFSGGLVDGYSVCEKVWGQQTIGRWEGKDVLRIAKAQDVDNDLVLNVDPHRNIVSIQGLRYNAGLVFDTRDFVIWRHLGMYNLPTGMSDLRAAYMSYWMLDTVRKLRAKGATKRAFPFIWGTYPDASKQPALENALAKINSQNWFSCPEGVQLQLLDVAGSSSDYFQSFTESLQKEIALSIEGAVLQQQTGGVGQSRGATSGHKDTADLRKWWLSECFCHSVLNHEETGLIPEMVGRNFAGVKEFPIASLGGVDAAELAEELKIDDGLSKLGFLQTAEDLGKRYGRKQAPPGEECAPPQPMGPDGQPMGGDGADGGPGEDWLSKSLAGAANGNGENGNGNGNGHKNGNGKPKPTGGGGESFAEWDEGRLAKLAAMPTKTLERLSARYGVKASDELRANVRNYLEKFVETSEITQ